jgi:eukaryotic-like serine/threonine-protein kinase
MSANRLPAEPGAKIGPYVVVSLLGAGGMGEVYRARDERLGRDVAIKVINAERCTDPRALQRFNTEGRAAARLSHPNIVAVYDVGQQEGSPYLVTELVRGGTLSARMASGPMPPVRCVELAVVLADALAEAHRQGVLHRDLKPDNILLTTTGVPKISDFGLARCFDAEPASSKETTQAAGDRPAEPAPTVEGMVIGTIPFMSPEQAAGRPVDFRSDQFSFGTILSQMLSGRNPFHRDSNVETLAAILRDEPDPSVLESIDPAIGTIIRRCLEKDPANRYRSTDELVHDLRALAPRARTMRPKPAPRIWWLGVLLMLALAVWIQNLNREPAAISPPPKADPTLAVLPFRNISSDRGLAHFGLGIADGVIGRLATVRKLIVRPTSAVARFEDQSVDAIEAGRRLHVDHVLDGSFLKTADSIRITAQLVDVSRQATIWSETIDVPEGELFKLQDTTSSKIVRALQIRLAPEQRHPFGDNPVSDRAMEEYLSIRGQIPAVQRSGPDERAVVMQRLDRLIASEPKFARALGTRAYVAAISNFYVPSQHWLDVALTDANRALAIDEELIEPRLARATVLFSASGGWRTYDALRELQTAVKNSPGDEAALKGLVFIERHVGDFQAVADRARAIDRIDPNNSYAPRQRAIALLESGQCAESIKAFARAVDQPGDVYPIWQQATPARIHCGDRSARTEMEERHAHAVPGSLQSAMTSALLALARVEDGEREIGDLEREALANDQRAGHFHHVLAVLAEVHARLGDNRGAVGYLRRAAETGLPCLYCFEHNPFLATARETAEYAALAREMREQERSSTQ